MYPGHLTQQLPCLHGGKRWRELLWCYVCTLVSVGLLAGQRHNQLRNPRQSILVKGGFPLCFNVIMLWWLTVGQDIHSSRDGAHIPPCSHLLHSSCYQDMLTQGLYACPTCGLAMQEKCSLNQIFFSMLMPIQFTDCIQKRGLLIDCKSEHHFAGYVQSLEKHWQRGSEHPDA